MRILMINKFLYPNGGSETYIFKLGEFLVNQGHEVQYFGMEHKSRCVGNYVESYTTNMDFRTGPILSKLAYPLRTIYSREARVKIRKVLDDFKPDVCHLNNFNYQLTPSIILEIKKWNKECKIIYTAHDCQLICPAHLLFNTEKKKICEKCIDNGFVECAKNKCIHNSFAKSLVGTIEAIIWNKFSVYKNINYIICPSNFIKTKLDSNSNFITKTKVLKNFVDINFGSVEQVTGIPSKYVLYIGRYSKEKGIDTLIECAKLTPQINYVFAGKGDYNDSIKQCKNIVDVGFKQRESLNYLIKNSVVVVNASECYETFGLSIGEAIMMGKCVIGTDIGAIPELIEEGVNGLLFKHGDVNSLKSTIEKVYFDEELQKKLDDGTKCISMETLYTYYKKIMEIYLNA